jgi:hypothetical protein
MMKVSTKKGSDQYRGLKKGATKTSEPTYLMCRLTQVLHITSHQVQIQLNMGNITQEPL